MKATMMFLLLSCLFTVCHWKRQEDDIHDKSSRGNTPDNDEDNEDQGSMDERKRAIEKYLRTDMRNDSVIDFEFLGLASGDTVPDANTIRNFFEGQIVDASFVLAPRQLDTRKENKKIKKGEDFFGYKVGAKMEGKSKFVKKIVNVTTI